MKVLVIYAHPDAENLNFQIYKRVTEGLVDAGHKVEKVNLYDQPLDFKRIKQKKDSHIKDLQEKIKTTDSLVMVYPVWWYNMPAIVKNFIDRIFEQDFAFTVETSEKTIPVINKKFKKTIRKGLLTNLKKVTIINTADSSWFKRAIVYRDSSFTSFKRGVLNVIGAKNVKNTVLHPISSLSEAQQKETLEKAYQIGKNF